LEINGYTVKDWAGALPLEKALESVTPFLEGSALGGHNPYFDLRFLQAAFQSLKRPFPRMDYHIFDTVNLAWPLKYAGLVESVSLEPLCRFLGIPLDAHHALDDARASLRVARRLLPEYTVRWIKP